MFSGVSIGCVMSYDMSPIGCVMSYYMSLQQCQFLIEVRVEARVSPRNYSFSLCSVSCERHMNTLIPLRFSPANSPILPGALPTSVRILVLAGGDLVIPSFLVHFLASLLLSGICLYQSGPMDVSSAPQFIFFTILTYSAQWEFLEADSFVL